MRECPNCSQQIQDDAVFCRHCHTELEPPLWITSMRKCPYCAEWVDIKLERCNYCDRPLVSEGSEHTAPFIESSDEPEDFSKTLRDNLLADDSEEAAAIAAAAAEFVAEEPDESLAGLERADTPFLDELREYEETQEQVQADALAASAAAFESAADDPAPPNYEQPQSDLRRSLYEDDSDDVADSGSLYSEAETPYSGDAEYEQPPEPEPSQYPADPNNEPSTYEPASDVPAEYIEPPMSATDSGIWMAGAAEEEKEYLEKTSPSVSDDIYGRSTAGTEGVSDLRDGASGPPGKVRRSLWRAVRTIILIAVFGASAYGLYVLSQGPLGSAITDALATDIPTETPIPLPTATLRPAPTLPPEFTEVPTAGVGIISTGVPTELAGCVPWDAISLADEGSELCAYGIIKRWWAGDEIPFIAIFSEEEGTFAIIDRTSRYPVGPGSCIVATGIVEVMGGTRPNIDAQGALEDCPPGVGDA